MQDLRITRMEIISFGKLKNLVLEPGKGINVLTAPNESGKSTLAAFLKFVLYGFTDGRKKELAENDKKLYTPWDNSVAEGSVTLWAGEKLYRVVRSAGGTKESCTLTEVATGKTLPAGEVPGEYLFGVSEEVFSRTVILDPPAFAKHHKVLGNALQGYKKINARALEKIRPGGILFTFSCSQAVSRDLFRTTIFTAAAIARRKVRIIGQLTQPADHPINIYHPEGEYLKGLVVYVE